MSTINQDLADFNLFVAHHLENSNAARSLDELFDLWRTENPSFDSKAEDIAAIASAVEDFHNGDRGRPAGELSQELRSQYQLSSR